MACMDVYRYGAGNLSEPPKHTQTLVRCSYSSGAVGCHVRYDTVARQRAGVVGYWPGTAKRLINWGGSAPPDPPFPVGLRPPENHEFHWKL